MSTEPQPLTAEEESRLRRTLVTYHDAGMLARLLASLDAARAVPALDAATEAQCPVVMGGGRCLYYVGHDGLHDWRGIAARAVPALDAIKALRPKGRIYVEEDDYVSGFGDAKDAAIRALSDARAVPALDAEAAWLAGWAAYREDESWAYNQSPEQVASHAEAYVAALSGQQSKGET